MFDNPRTTILLVLTSVFCLLVSFTPMASVADLVNFQVGTTTSMVLAVVAIVLAIDALAVIFLGQNKNKKALARLKTQLTFNKLVSLGLLVFLIALGVIIYLNNLLESPNHEWAFPALALISNFLAGNSINNDIKTLRSEDRLR